MLLVIDNYDSFTWNLVQLLGEMGAEPVVKRNDEIDADALEALAPDRLVISPGPCTPAEAGVSVEAARRLGGRGTPVLGVCLGHQAIGAAFGARIERARRVMHGKRSPVRHTGTGIFAGLPDRIEVARYHSLVVSAERLPEELEVVAWTDEPGWEDEVQALRHTRLPVWGVQFHPESIATQGGRTLLGNFLACG